MPALDRSGKKPASKGTSPCLGCGKPISPTKTLCAACAEDMGYSRKAR